MEHSYHGDTIGTMSRRRARRVQRRLRAAAVRGRHAFPSRQPGHEQETLDGFEAVCRDRPRAALIVEPLVLGAGGMLMYPAWVLAELKEIAEAMARCSSPTR